MTTVLKFKGYVATIKLDLKEEVFVGRVINTQDVIAFEANTVKDLTKAFREAIKDYEAYCRKEGLTPEKPFNGQFVVRTDSELHKEIFELAAQEELSMNDFAVAALRRMVQEKRRQSTESNT